MIIKNCRGSSGTGSTGLAEPINFERRVLQPVNFSGRKTKNSEFYLVVHRLNLGKQELSNRSSLITNLS